MHKIITELRLTAAQKRTVESILAGVTVSLNAYDTRDIVTELFESAVEATDDYCRTLGEVEDLERKVEKLEGQVAERQQAKPEGTAA